MIKHITKQEYLNLLVGQADRLKDIDTHQYSDNYIALTEGNKVLAVCGVHYQKANITQVNGLVSFVKGNGIKLLNNIEGRFIRLNCTKELYEKVYEPNGFVSYFTIDSYVECIRRNEE